MAHASRQPLLLLHGFTDTAATWAPLTAHLSPTFDLIAPTLVGHHGGPPVPAQMTDPVSAMLDDLERQLDERSIERLPVVGNSLGGWLAFALAARGRATTVLALSPALGWATEAPPTRTRLQFARAHRLAPLGARLARTVVRTSLGRRLAFWELVAHPQRIPPSTAVELIRGAADCPMYEPWVAFQESGRYREGWKDVSVDTVIAWGTHDRTIPLSSCSAWFRDRLPDARWIDLPGCGHLPHHDDPELVAALVREVFSGDSPLLAG
jgi:pimeloyl-ACP methyl ester carboxylesterase